ncbi:MAG: DUF899 domain-containing protein [Verrucomicrobia bacterium]|nr:DUF899 domain-containing protein [Verrucomicrobiota bacterium]
MTKADLKHKVVSPTEWLEARKKLLVQEKEFTRLRDQLSRQRRELPWVKVEKEYVFEGPKGKETLADLFEGRSQLVVYHFMFAPEWDEGCPSCSFWADNFNAIGIHLKHRDVTLAAISRAPIEKLSAFKKRMDWSFRWVSSGTNDFNYDYQVSFPPGVPKKELEYNYRELQIDSPDLPGVSVFYQEADGNIFHTYSAYSRGIDILNTAYNYLDLVPRGRDEEELEFSMDWLRYHDRYEEQTR